MGKGSPQAEGAESPQVARIPAGLPFTLQVCVFLGLRSGLCPSADSLSLGEAVAFSSSDLTSPFSLLPPRLKPLFASFPQLVSVGGQLDHTGCWKLSRAQLEWVLKGELGH